MADGGPLIVVIFPDINSMVLAVEDGTIIAGLATSRPENEDGLLIGNG